mmetsp:Transcript_19048/g.57546  ORF Transcript_19048/g.57546 Transcript_19048/m.57546 type:complete len:254 (+) Transcript_19048:476-1237(+)
MRRVPRTSWLAQSTTRSLSGVSINKGRGIHLATPFFERDGERPSINRSTEKPERVDAADRADHALLAVEWKGEAAVDEFSPSLLNSRHREENAPTRLPVRVSCMAQCSALLKPCDSWSPSVMPLAEAFASCFCLCHSFAEVNIEGGLAPVGDPYGEAEEANIATMALLAVPVAASTRSTWWTGKEPCKGKPRSFTEAKSASASNRFRSRPRSAESLNAGVRRCGLGEDGGASAGTLGGVGTRTGAVAVMCGCN